jgi:CRISPR-associated endonuclease/helicase Cas3
MAERQRQRHNLRGNFVGLPTQATSNQMFSRVVKALSQGACAGTAQLMLLHGHACLSTEFEDLKRNAAGVSPRSSDGERFSPAHVIAGDWFTYRKRGLLAPYGVGTVDQTLMAACSQGMCSCDCSVSQARS